MSLAGKVESDEPGFRWGNKRGVGGPNKDVQFYGSFTYDGLEYTLYDCICLYNRENEEHPHIGMLIRMWEKSGKPKRIKVQWFFRGSEISYWLKYHNLEALENELFFATGKGLGVANVNPVEAVVGKCSVVCISRDHRNPQPSKEHLQIADFVFCRTFDVDECIISDKMGDKIGEVEVRYVFNREKNDAITGPRIGSKSKREDSRIDVVFEENLPRSGKKRHKSVEIVRKEGDVPSIVNDKEQVEDITMPTDQVVDCETTERDPYNLGGRPSKKELPSNDAKVIKGKGVMKAGHQTSNREDFKVSTTDNSKEKRKPDPKRDLVEVSNDKKIEENSSSLDANPSKKQRIESSIKLFEVKEINDKEKSCNDAKVMKGKAVEISSGDLYKEKRDMGKDLVGVVSKFDKDSSSLDHSPLNDKRDKVTKNLNCLENINAKEISNQKMINFKKMSQLTNHSSGSNEDSFENTSKITKTSSKLDKILSNEMHDGKIMVPIKDSTSLNKGSSKDNPIGKTNVPVRTSSGMDKGLSLGVDGIDNGSPMGKPNGEKRMPSKSSLGMDKGPSFDMDRLEMVAFKEKLDGKGSEPVKSSFVVVKGRSDEKLNRKNTMVPDENMDKISVAGDHVGKIYEVSQRPNAEKGKWYKSAPWEEGMMVAAYNETRLVLLQNLDPGFTSREIEDIVWSAFKENCTAKMVQSTSFSSPHYGQAFVILRTREVAERVVGKLNGECLLLLNQRPLVGSIVKLPPSPRKQSTFVGHLLLDKIKLQMQKEKNSESTCHCAQPNNIEYELAMDWCLLYARFDLHWQKLHKLFLGSPTQELLVVTSLGDW